MIQNMPTKKAKSNSCSPQFGLESCCKVEAVLTVDERGQMVLPKEVRTKAKIQSGDKLALVSWEQGGEICCISLFKVEALSAIVTNILEPIMKATAKK